MTRKEYIADDILSLSEYIESEDDLDCYHCWQDEDHRADIIISQQKHLRNFQKAQLNHGLLQRSSDYPIIFVSVLYLFRPKARRLIWQL